jgi:hypothetical protein
MDLRKGRIAAFGVLAAACLPLAAPSTAQSANGVGSPFELAFWQSVAGSDDPAIYEAYLQQYPSGTFAGLARAKLATLRKTLPVAEAVLVSQPATAPVSAPEPAPRVSPPPASPVAAQMVQVAVLTPPRPEALAPAPAQAQAPAPAPAAKQPAMVQPAVVTGAQADSDAALLVELARSQEPGAGTARVAAAQGFVLPQRPELAELAELPVPSSFCSAEQRNAFYETRYKPVLELSRANNAAAIGHMQKLQEAYDGYQLSRDPTPMNLLANEARDYQQQVAAMTYSRQASIVRQFDAIMAVPIIPCAVAVAAK